MPTIPTIAINSLNLRQRMSFIMKFLPLSRLSWESGSAPNEIFGGEPHAMMEFS
jgi:hypothetical protein